MEGARPGRATGAPVRFDDAVPAFQRPTRAKVAGRRVAGWGPRGSGCDRRNFTRTVVEVVEILSAATALKDYRSQFVSPFETTGKDSGIRGEAGWTVHLCQRGNVLELVDSSKTGDDGRPLVVARIVGGGVASVDRDTLTTLKTFAVRAPDIMATKFEKKRNSGPGRGEVAIIGARLNIFQNYSHPVWGKFGDYACNDGEAGAHHELVLAAKFVAHAMIEADAPYNAEEHSRARSMLAGRCWTGRAGAPQPLTDVYPAATIGCRACNPQHIDDADLIGGLFTPLGDADLLFALSQYQIYVRVRHGDVLYVNTPHVVHGACVPPEGYTGNAAYQTHLVLGLFCKRNFGYHTEAERRWSATPPPAHLWPAAPTPRTRARAAMRRCLTTGEVGEASN